MMWKLTTYFYLIAVSGFAGAAIGSCVGGAISEMTGERDFISHGRCAGWTVLTLIGAVAAPFGFVRFCDDTGRRMVPFEREWTPPADQRTEAGIKAILIAPLIGGFMGFILAFPLSAILTAVYFFVVLSPVAPGGWWPILPPAFRSIGDGFVVVVLAIAGTCVLLGAVLTLLVGVSCGKTRFQVFGKSDGREADHPRDHEPNKPIHGSGEGDFGSNG